MIEHLSQQRYTNRSCTYPTGRLPSLRRILDTLSIIEIEHESDIQTVRDSSIDEGLKRETISNLNEHCRKQQSPYVRQLAAMQERTETAGG